MTEEILKYHTKFFKFDERATLEFLVLDKTLSTRL